MRGAAVFGGLLIGSLGLSGTRAVAPHAHGPDVAPPKETVTADPVEPAAPPDEPREDPSPATRYVSLASDACLAELDARQIEYKRVERPDVDTPVRLLGPLSTVRFHTLLPKEARDRSPYEIFDCRLVLALDDFAKILRRHDIVDVMLFSAFRPLVPGVVKRGHERALAIDVAYFGRADGGAYSILRDFTPIAHEHPCRPLIHATGPRELRAFVCEAVEERIFHVALTPDYDAAHHDHFHLELVPGAVSSYAR